jgi:hypothetical protein
MNKLVAAMILIVASITYAAATEVWRLDAKGVSGPLARVDLPDKGGRRRTVFVAAEYERRCDPIFSYIELSGSALGAPTSQSLLKDSKIGIILNGNFYTWHAAKTSYSNGYEAAFGLQNDILLQLLINVNSLVYVTPSGEKITLPTGNFQKSLQAAIEVCRKRVQ